MSAPIAPAAGPGTARPRAARRLRRGTSLVAHGEPMLWLTAGMLVVALVMTSGLLVLIAVRGLSTFWPAPLARLLTLTSPRA